MAGLDYVKCGMCFNRLFYDGEQHARVSMSDMGSTETLTCDTCVKRLERKIDTLQKHDRRRH